MKLGEIGKVSMCKRIMKDQTLPNGDIPFYKIGTFGKEPNAFISKEIYDEFSRKYSFPKKGEILISASGTIGRLVRYDGKPAYFQDSNIVWLSNDEKQVLNDYLYRFYEICNWKSTKGATISRLYNDNLRQIEIAFPKSLPEQQRIVSILDECFVAIDKAKANAERNLKNAQELFESYLEEVFEQKGNSWDVKRFEELCKLTRGHNPPKSKFISQPKNGYIRFYQIRDGWVDDYAVYVPDTPQLHKVAPDEILMVAYRHIGKVFRGVSGAFNVALCKISIKDRNILNEDFLFHMIPTDIVKGQLMKRSERSLIPSMSVEHLKEILIPLPTLKEQQTIVSKLNALSAETKRLEAIYQQKLLNLEELKKSILQKAFNGEL